MDTVINWAHGLHMDKLLTLLLLLTGCAQEDLCFYPESEAEIQAVYDATAERWEAEVGPLEGRGDLVVVTEFLDASDLECKPPPEGYVTQGCTWQEDGVHHVQIVKCGQDAIGTLEHEYAHILLQLTTGDGDAGHTRTDVWGPVADL